jgi:hypothetical protein
MWLFTGRYAQYGPTICAVALVVIFIGVAFMAIAARLALRHEVKSWSFVVLLTLTAAITFGESVGFGEPIFVPGYGLNLGAALILAISATSIGFTGVVLPRNLRGWRILLLVLAAGMLFGDVAGWIRRSGGPSKYNGDSSASSAPSGPKRRAF